MGVPDGPKAIGCSSDYVVCLFGTTNWLKCENDLKFDEDTLQCVTAVRIHLLIHRISRCLLH